MRSVLKKIFSVTICVMLLFLTACSDKQTQLEGTYTANLYGTGISYTFSGDTVTADCTIIGFDVMHYDGTYSLNEEQQQITLNFDLNQTNYVDAEKNMISLGGTFEFQRGEDYIIIGNVKYQKNADSNTESNLHKDSSSVVAEQTNSIKDEPKIPLSSIHLNLPEDYEMTYQITETVGISRTYTNTMIKTEQGYYFNFSDSGEQLIFEKLESGKYIQYFYQQGRFVAPALSDSVQMQIANGTMTKDMVAVDDNVVNGYASRLTACFDFYENYRGNMTYQGEEVINSWKCQKYTAVTDSVSGTHTVDLWIVSEYGLCVKASYEYDSPLGGTATKIMECTEFLTENIVFPEYN